MEHSSTWQQRIWEGEARWGRLLWAALWVGLSARVAFLGRRSLWLDEGLSLGVAQAGQAALWQGISVKDHPPLYFWLLELWLRFGHSEAHLRLLSAAAGVAAIPLAFGLARVIFSRPVAVTAAWLTALSPLLIWYSQEIRNYSQLVLCGLGATYALAQLWLDPHPSRARRGARWAFYVLCMAAALYTHYMAVLVIAVQALLYTGLAASGRVRARAIWPWLTAAAAVLLAYAPWLRSQAAGHFVDLLGRNALYPARLLIATLGIGETYLQPVLGFGLASTLVVGLVLAYLIFRRPRAFWLRGRAGTWFQVGLVVFFAAALVMSVLPRGYTVKRQLLVLAPYPLLGLAWFWPWTPDHRRVLTVALALSLVASAVSLAVAKDQWREAVRYVHARAAPDDVVLLLVSDMGVPFDYMSIPFDYYNQDRVARLGILPAGSAALLPALRNHHARTWLITHTADIADPSRQVQSWLDSHARLIDERSFYRLEVRLYAND